jgi:DNA-binding FadR family transcriptional regulator
MVGPAQRPLKQAEIVARAIADQIVTENLPEGTMLPHERQMLETYQVGRSTLREALRVLESRGVITIRSGREGGPVVRRPRPSDLGESLTLQMQFRGLPVTDIFAARQAIEPLLARMAAKDIDDETLTRMTECNERILANLDDRAMFRAENMAFHEMVASAAQSPLLEIFASALESVADGAGYGLVAGGFTYEQRATTVEAHREIIAALAARDPEAAEAAMRAHLEQGRANFTSAYAQFSSSPDSLIDFLHRTTEGGTRPA